VDHAAARCTIGDGDALTVTEGNGDRTLGRIGQGRRVGDAGHGLADLRSGGQADGGDIDGVDDAGLGRGRIHNQALEVAAAGAADAGADGGRVDVDVLVRNDRVDHAAARCTIGDGDGLAVTEGNGDRTLGRIGQGRRVGDAGHGLADLRGGGQADRGDIDGVDDAGLGRGRIHHQALEVAAAGAAGAADAGTDGARVDIDVLVRNDRVDHAAGRRTMGDGDGLAVTEGNGDVTLGRVGQGRRVGYGGAGFRDLRSGGQADGGDVDGVHYIGERRSGVHHQVLEVAAAGTRDAGTDSERVDVNILVWPDIMNDTAARRTIGDGDGLAIREVHCEWTLGRIGQGRRVGDAGHSLGDLRSSRQADGGGIDGVDDLRCCRGIADFKRFEVAAGYTAYGSGYGARIDIDIRISRVQDQCTTGLPGRDDDGAKVCNNSDIGFTGITQGGREGDTRIVLGDVEGTQADGGSVDGI